MNKEMREPAERSIRNLTEIVERLNQVHEDCKTLSLDHGLDLAYDEIAEMGMRIGRIALFIVDSIAEDDEWGTHWSKK